MEDQDTRIALLEARVQALEDIISVYQTMSTYGPTVDSDLPEAASLLWTADGEFVVDDEMWKGREAIRGLFEGDFSRSLRARGGSHQISLPHVKLDGANAVATCYQQVLVRNGNHHETLRNTVTRWELVRDAGTWRMARRTNRLLDGSEPPRQLLRRVVQHAETMPQS